MKKLIFDSAITGHHTEYINHLLDYIKISGTEKDQYIFVVNPFFRANFPEIADKAKNIGNCVWQEITTGELENIENKKRVNTDLFSLKTVKKYAKKFEADHVLLMNLNAVLYGTLFVNVKFTFSGILFSHFSRLPKSTLKHKTEYYKRWIQIKRLQSNKKLTNIFILNDTKGVSFLNKHFNTKVFEEIPDPIPVLEPSEGFEIYKHYNINRERNIFLHIGSLGNRKGSVEIIKSLPKIDASIQHKIAVLFVGKAASETEKKQIEEAIKNNQPKCNIGIVWDSNFVSFSIMKSIFDQCFSILMPYNNVEFSSGILGHAAAANKKVIATENGLIKELVNKYDLGLLIPSSKPNYIAKAIEDFFKISPNSEKAQQFVNEHTPKKFAEHILKNKN